MDGGYVGDLGMRAPSYLSKGVHPTLLLGLSRLHAEGLLLLSKGSIGAEE
jgi:hypothetical protein